MNRINEREALRQYLLDNGLYMVQKSEFETLANDAAKSFKDYPLCIYITGDKYDEDLTSQNLRVSLNCMIDEGIIYSDSKDLNGLVILMPPGYTGIKTLSYIWNGGFKVLYRQGISAMKRIANYESFAKHKGYSLEQGIKPEYDFRKMLVVYLSYFISTVSEALSHGYDWDVVSQMIWCDLTFEDYKNCLKSMLDTEYN